MANERWNSPFPHTIAFVLFKEHFTELNHVYWAHVPAASTIEKKALEALKSEDADPKRYFLIPDKDDRRIPKTYAQWKSFYREFSNYTRLNMLMLLSSCFETYLRTIVSLSLESKPGVIIKAPDAVDGWLLSVGILSTAKNMCATGKPSFSIRQRLSILSLVKYKLTQQP